MEKNHSSHNQQLLYRKCDWLEWIPVRSFDRALLRWKSCSIAATLALTRLAVLLKVNTPIPARGTRSILGFIFWQFLGQRKKSKLVWCCCHRGRARYPMELVTSNFLLQCQASAFKQFSLWVTPAESGASKLLSFPDRHAKKPWQNILMANQVHLQVHSCLPAGTATLGQKSPEACFKQH